MKKKYFLELVETKKRVVKRQDFGAMKVEKRVFLQLVVKYENLIEQDEYVETVEINTASWDKVEDFLSFSQIETSQFLKEAFKRGVNRFRMGLTVRGASPKVYKARLREIFNGDGLVSVKRTA